MRCILMKAIFCLLIITAGVSAKSQSEKKQDVVVKLNGDQLTGKVLEIGDSSIRFTYTGEELVYTIRKSEIARITFASGRAETFNHPHDPSAATTATGTSPATQAASEDRRNKVAILPFAFTKDGQQVAPAVSEEVQNECYALLSKHSGVYTVVGPRAINVKLNKAGITKENIQNYTMEELCHILGVEYVVDGMITQNRTSQSNYANSTYSDKSKENNDKDKKSSGYGSTYSTSVQNYETTMDLKIYNDKSEIVYNQNRKAFWKTEDAYKNTMEYLVKRCPLYTK